MSGQIEQIRQWDAGALYPEHDTFSFGHGFGAALLAEFDKQERENKRLRDALAAILAVEPRSDTTRLGVVEWSRALDEAQRIAADALPEGEER